MSIILIFTFRYLLSPLIPKVIEPPSITLTSCELLFSSNAGLEVAEDVLDAVHSILSQVGKNGVLVNCMARVVKMVSGLFLTCAALPKVILLSTSCVP